VHNAPLDASCALSWWRHRADSLCFVVYSLVMRGQWCELFRLYIRADSYRYKSAPMTWITCPMLRQLRRRWLPVATPWRRVDGVADCPAHGARRTILMHCTSRPLCAVSSHGRSSCLAAALIVLQRVATNCKRSPYFYDTPYDDVDRRTVSPSVWDPCNGS